LPTVSDVFSLSCRPVDADGLVVVEVSGELDIEQADRVREGLTRAAQSPNCRHLRVDLGGLTSVDSVGLGSLIAGYNATAATGATFAVTHATPYVRNIIRVLGLDSAFGLAPDCR
jgi:anti-anti-sigma factor